MLALFTDTPAKCAEVAQSGAGLAQILRDLPSEVLLDERARSRGYLRPDAVETIIRQHHAGESDHSLRLWVLLQLEMWQREVVDARGRLATAA